MNLGPYTTKSDFQRRWWAKKGVIYFMAAGDPPQAIKIGISQWSRANTRIAACQTGNHEPLELLGVIPFLDGDYPVFHAEKEESRLHKQFEYLRRFRLHSRGHEWFTAGPDLLDFICRHSRPPEEFGFSRRVSELLPRAKK